MLKKLQIENFLTIKKMEIEFDAHLTAIAGESGSGKSLILRAVDALFSQKAPTNLIGNFSDKAHIKLLIEPSKKQISTLEEFGIEGDEILLERLLFAGRTRIYINKEPTSSKIISSLRDLFVDVVSQEYRFKAFDSDNLIKVLDRFIDKNLLEEFKNTYKKYQKLLGTIESLKKDIEEISATHPEVLLEAIERVNPKEGEYDELLAQSSRMKAASYVRKETAKMIDYLFESELSVELKLGEFISTLKRMEESGFDIERINEAFDRILDELTQVKQPLYSMLDFSVTEQDIDAVESRLFELEELQRKFGMSLDEIVKKKRELRELIRKKEEFEFELGEKKKELLKLEEELCSFAGRLTEARKRIASDLRERILNNLARVGLGNSIVVFEFARKSLDVTGRDRVSILFSANPDIEPNRIEKVASGGERSRFILAVEAACSEDDQGRTLFLDEIETGISDKTLKKVSGVVKELSKTHQIVLITHNQHLIEVSDMAYRVEKVFEDNSTRSYLKRMK